MSENFGARRASPQPPSVAVRIGRKSRFSCPIRSGNILHVDRTLARVPRDAAMELVMNNRIARLRVLAIGAALSFACSAGPGAVRAQDNLLQQGRGMLEGMLQGQDAGGDLSEVQIGDGLREALRVGTERVTASLGQVDGFNANPDVHIPLPQSLQTVQSALGMVGMSGLADDLELRMNRAAETAAPEAKELFWQAVSEMTLQDAQGILSGPDDAATRYFQDKMTAPLTERFTPVVDRELADAGAVQAYDQMMGDYGELPFAPDVQANLTPYVVQQALDGMFLLLAREEAAIRQDPAARTTELLQTVFGS
jgi:hypothetical protein